MQVVSTVSTVSKKVRKPSVPERNAADKLLGSLRNLKDARKELQKTLQLPASEERTQSLSAWLQVIGWAKNSAKEAKEEHKAARKKAIQYGY